MKEKLKNLIVQKKQLILYLVFGVITTVCSLGACYVTLRLGVLLGWKDETGDPTALLDTVGSVVQWVVGVLVAFWTNKKWVFTEAEHGGRATWHQLVVFSGSRVLTLLLEIGLNLGSIALLEAIRIPEPTILGFTLSARVWAKAISSVVIVIANYFISKLLVFRKKDKKDKKDEKTS